jgi:transcriptional regulator with XRE-family HTH domain
VPMATGSSAGTSKGASTVAAASHATAPRKDASVVLMRRLLGEVLRRRRTAQGRTLREVAASARVSLGYLSEVERGRKEASSELLAAICSALGLPMSAVMREVSDELARAEAAAVGALTARQPQRAASELEVAGSFASS